MPVLWKDDVLGWARFSTGKEKSRENLLKVTYDGAAYAIVAIVLGILLAYLNRRVQMTAVTREGTEIPVEISIGKRRHRSRYRRASGRR